MANAQKVANIFELASVAFKKLSDLTIDLKIFQTQAEQGPSTSSRWTIIEIEALKEAVARFGKDLNKIASMIETKTITQIKHKLKSQALEGPMSERTEGDENDDVKDVDELPEGDVQIQELPSVSAVSVDRGRRKQTFSERNDFGSPEVKKKRLDSTSPMIVPRPVVPSAVRPVIPAVQRLPSAASSTSTKPHSRLPVTPSASSILSHAHMRKQAMIPTEAKYEDYSDFEGDDPYEDVDDDDDEASDEPYYSEEEAEVGGDDGETDQ